MTTITDTLHRLEPIAAAKPILHSGLIAQVRAGMKGQVITPEDADYDAVRTSLSREAVRRPALIVRPVDAGDVARVVSLARETGMELAIRSGGHSLLGFSTSDGGIVLDLSQMKGMVIDAEQRTAWAEAGLTAGEYTLAAAEYGLATGFGDTASVGLGGLTTGGGIGYLVRKYGLTIDNLLAYEASVTSNRPTQRLRLRHRLARIGRARTAARCGYAFQNQRLASGRAHPAPSARRLPEQGFEVSGGCNHAQHIDSDGYEIPAHASSDLCPGNPSLERTDLGLFSYRKGSNIRRA